MKKLVRMMTIRDCKEAIENTGEIICPLEKTKCAYKHNPIGLEYGNLSDITRWPMCENCGCELTVEWGRK